LGHNASKHLGTPLWTEQTRIGPGRLGGRRRNDGLTPTKQKFAELAADGLANKEMSAGLFVTVSTVEAALTSIYQKLGVRSRPETARKLTDTDAN
jgi:DNA-binding NarL/FixJ family response regulator